ncbi:hypothetical protein PQ472_07795 [Lacticaseibacillus pabuli]|uniref:DUF8033 domain-containing protein n=1 Tax=Lacticaseibacillus pabuli TaxID=3025672 RepID=A0ABY7WNP6_9LACO|nr:hypothetical protein [Lacticaseibacillus sp. KACC 23028]WDF81827.1 hypothetical protein PQ472_07795 [Lacticaseibacillus sp. KACC 23028]
MKRYAYDLDKLTADYQPINTVELSPKYESQKSFYGKAYVTTFKNGLVQLVSYTTIVGYVTPAGKLLLNGLYSATTERHIHDFALQFSTDYHGGPLSLYVMGK